MLILKVLCRCIENSKAWRNGNLLQWLMFRKYIWYWALQRRYQRMMDDRRRSCSGHGKIATLYFLSALWCFCKYHFLPHWSTNTLNKHTPIRRTSHLKERNRHPHLLEGSSFFHWLKNRCSWEFFLLWRWERGWSPATDWQIQHCLDQEADEGFLWDQAHTHAGSRRSNTQRRRGRWPYLQVRPLSQFLDCFLFAHKVKFMLGVDGKS